MMGWSLARKAQYRLTMPTVPEHAIQTSLAKMLTLELAPAGKLSGHGVVWFAVDHANYAGEVPGVRISRGIISGIPDTFVLYRGRAHLIELKSADGRLSEAQQEVIAVASLAGVKCAVCDDPFDVLRALDTWAIPRKRRFVLPLPVEGESAEVAIPGDDD